MLPELTGRSIAKNLADAEKQGSAFAIHKKRGQPEQAYRTRVEPQKTGGYKVVASDSLRSLGRQNLASQNRKNEGRRMAGAALVEFNPDYNIDQASDKYARINNLQGKEVHHMLEIDGSSQIYGAMSPELQRTAAAIALAENFRFSDHKNNQIALYGDVTNVPGPRTRAGKVILPAGHPGKGEHQTDGGVHQIQAELMRMAGLPSPRQPEALGNLVRKQKTDEQKLAIDKIFRHSGRLAIQKVKNVNRQAQGKSYAKIYEGMADLHFPQNQQSEHILSM